jgi:hypothetical protein
MRFDARELKPYAEPVSVTELKEGSVYFLVNFLDDSMHLPSMETLVFIGRNQEGRFQFQDLESYRQGVRPASATSDDEVNLFECSEAQLKCIFQYEQALEELMRCSLRRRGTRGGIPGT